MPLTGTHAPLSWSLVQAQQAASAPWYKDVPFDVVVGWYNQTDPERKALRKKYNPNDTFTYGTEPNMGEIYLSLASIQHFMPWVNKIFLVSSACMQSYK